MQATEIIQPTYLRPLSVGVIVVGDTDGTETFASSGLFEGGICGKIPHSSLAKPTLAMRVSSHQLVQASPFAEFLGRSFGEDRRSWQVSQITWLYRYYPEYFRTGMFPNFFEMLGGIVGDIRVVRFGILKFQGLPITLRAPWFEWPEPRVWSLEDKTSGST